jgi:hypothetical protein
LIKLNGKIPKKDGSFLTICVPPNRPDPNAGTLFEKPSDENPMIQKTTEPASQSDRFKEAARELGCDEDEAHFEEKLKKVAGHKPTDAPPPVSKKPEDDKPAK